MDSVTSFLGRQSYQRLLVGGLVLTYILPALLLWIVGDHSGISREHIKLPEEDAFERTHLGLRILLACLLAPLAETLCFQWGPLRLIPLSSATLRLVAVLCTALAFGLMHAQTMGSFFSKTVTGIIFSLLCLALIHAHRAAFLTVFAVHALRNGIALTLRAIGAA